MTTAFACACERWYSLLVCAAGAYFLILSVSNILYLRLRSAKPSLTDGPLLSVLIPARDEEDNIGRCLDSLLDQTYRNYEIIVYDDLSSDRTWEILSGYAARFPRVRAVRGKELPPGWFGKPHAMQRLAGHAGGDYLLFTDADTIHGPRSLSWAMTNILRYKTAMLSAYTRQVTGSVGEALVLSNIFLPAILFMPYWLIPRTKSYLFSHVIGQYIVMQAGMFRTIGGYESVRHRISEDIHLGREIKKRGFRTIFLDAAGHVGCRMYRGFFAAVNGINKNIFDFFEKHVVSIAALTVFITACILAPIAFLAVQAATGGPYAGRAAAGVGMCLLAWLLCLYDRKMPWYTPFLYPFLFLMIIVIAWKSVIDDTLGNGYLWKGRRLR